MAQEQDSTDKFTLGHHGGLVGILKAKCAIIPPFKRGAATPDEATTVQIIALESARLIIEFRR
ncbi:hypothetical protein PGTUg99_025351 [Puccinia graminis f. sp. tritici]|uniref:Uncharacterized protein n=1 Tax=Puccinia graminis f. sp. tritici TaxID=56615 RepID=A0A5B0SIB4_PUCGR|nr:hypothetical protein PGTUg99_001360 [Puccinia graminis f. sp. tritici]KAA1137587.1 hypothetical protein PGTUg99_025351 [Puccinia graminis f. sp. tritici]